jgi:hypothetical protein
VPDVRNRNVLVVLKKEQAIYAMFVGRTVLHNKKDLPYDDNDAQKFPYSMTSHAQRHNEAPTV